MADDGDGIGSIFGLLIGLAVFVLIIGGLIYLYAGGVPTIKYIFSVPIGWLKSLSR